MVYKKLKSINALIISFIIAGILIGLLVAAQFQSSVADNVPVTSDMAYFRFHGRNTEMWWKGDSETRYKYLYSPEEIKELSVKVRNAAGRTKLLFALFNNHWQGYAPQNAVSMMKALELPFHELPVQIPPGSDDEKK